MSIAVHTISILLVKWFTVEQYKKSNFLCIIVHALENTNMPNAFVDWDVEGGTIQDHRERMGKVMKEMTATMLVNFGFNLSMLVPLCYTGTSVINLCLSYNIYSQSAESCGGRQCLAELLEPKWKKTDLMRMHTIGSLLP